MDHHATIIIVLEINEACTFPPLLNLALSLEYLAPYDGQFLLLCPDVDARRLFRSLTDVITYYRENADGLECKLTRRLR